ncbi:hypothetical protein Tco_0565811 [Tanacetum coccineum]
MTTSHPRQAHSGSTWSVLTSLLSPRVPHGSELAPNIASALVGLAKSESSTFLDDNEWNLGQYFNEVVTALAAEEEHSTSPHSRAASSARGAQGSPTQSAAPSQGTASVQGTASFHGPAVPHDSDAVQGTDTLQGTAAYHEELDLETTQRTAIQVLYSKDPKFEDRSRPRGLSIPVSQYKLNSTQLKTDPKKKAKGYCLKNQKNKYNSSTNQSLELQMKRRLL